MEDGITGCLLESCGGGPWWNAFTSPGLGGIGIDGGGIACVRFRRALRSMTSCLWSSGGSTGGRPGLEKLNLGGGAAIGVLPPLICVSAGEAGSAAGDITTVGTGRTSPCPGLKVESPLPGRPVPGGGSTWMNAGAAVAVSASSQESGRPVL